MNAQWVIGQPMMIREISETFDVPVNCLEELLARHGIAPSFRMGRTRCYTPERVGRIHALLQKHRMIHERATEDDSGRTSKVARKGFRVVSS
jgi:hypothetical protein